MHTYTMSHKKQDI